ncbi:hypothetical protein Stok01_02484 [Sulfurisphaera tokodaii]|uniref:hypothetical protein n=1 Tax=Sulfurisphaera tokodaii TaxID=111955 RepID=UPI00069C20D2|nr:hypothetical protein [Sulfurisphaera tokodaii]
MSEEYYKLEVLAPDETVAEELNKALQGQIFDYEQATMKKLEIEELCPECIVVLKKIRKGGRKHD